MGRHVTIGHVCNSIADRSLKKQLHTGTSGCHRNASRAESDRAGRDMPWELPPEAEGTTLCATLTAARSTAQGTTQSAAPCGCKGCAPARGSMPITKTGHIGGHKLWGTDVVFASPAAACVRLFLYTQQEPITYILYKP